MDTNNKEVYEAPTMLIVEVKAEGWLCQSATLEDYPMQGYVEE